MQDIRTRLRRRPDGSSVLDGVKHYSTGALFADWIPVLARADDDNLHVAYVPQDAPGLTVQGLRLHGAVAQLLHAAIDAGIASGVLSEAVEFVRTKSRPWFESVGEGHATAAEASIAVATAKVTAAEAAVEAGSTLFEVVGTRAALDSRGLHRHWRDARTHTLHGLL
ncbi:hypothetical protein GCM10018780_86930 [Streptomyces lanatus]|nr:hypothetical protein GCM10018780_86930 [Streptomyces lanatus]